MIGWVRSTFVLLLLGMAQAALAGPLEDALATYSRGDYAGALRLLQPLAERGEVEAQYNLGIMYDKGQGVKRDYVEALKWLRLAAAQGKLEAELYVANIHEH